jgi:hypothetical protein
MEYLVSTNLSILNKGNEPAFVISNRKEVIDLTLETDKIGDLVTNWHVSDEISLSDHRYLVFQWVTWKLPGSHIAPPREPIGIPIGKT